MDTITQPFIRQNPAHRCDSACSQGTQLLPVAGNCDRAVHVFVVYHGHDYLNAAGEVTSTPVWLTYGHASEAMLRHAEAALA